MSRSTGARRTTPAPLRAAWRWWLSCWRPGRHLPRSCGHALSRTFITPGVQRMIPGLAGRVKIGPRDHVALIVTCGNRLAQLRRSLPTFVAQTRRNYAVVVSVYADREETARYVGDHFADEQRSGCLRVIDTAAQRFNKARALNIAVAATDAEYLLLVDVDCSLNGPNAVRDIVHHFNMQPYALCSMSVWGMILTRRDEFIELGGFDTGLSDGWAPDDFDYIARWVAYYQRPYASFATDYLFTIVPAGGGSLVRRKERWHPAWIINAGERDESFDAADFAHTKFYSRIGGLKSSKAEYFEATLRYFQEHNPRLEFVAAPPATDKVAHAG